MKSTTALAALLVVMQAPVRVQLPSNVPGPIGAEPLVVLNAERAWLGPDALWPLVNGDNISRDVRNAAVRAIGRAEDPQQVRPLMALTSLSTSTQASAIARSLYGFDPSTDKELLRLVDEWMRVKASEGRTIQERMIAAASLAGPMSHIVYALPEQVGHVESLLRGLVDSTADTPHESTLYFDGIRGLEALARINSRLVRYDDRTIALLKKCVARMPLNADSPDVRLYAFMALVAAGAVDADTERKALSDSQAGAWTVRRSAMLFLAGTGGGLDADMLPGAILDGLSDSDPHVRYEAVLAWARHLAPVEGCAPLVDALQDADSNVAIEATDLLGAFCSDNDDITDRLEAGAVVPPAAGAWQRQTHAFVALANRSPKKAALLMGAFASHQVWWVRMYAAFAAGAARDVDRLEKLAYDENDNVREAALHHLRALDGSRAEPAILAALGRSDVQLVHTAAGMLQESPPSRRYVRPLLDALQRLSRAHSMTSRDGRLALLGAIEKHGAPDDHTELVPWLKDVDPKIADRAADVIYHLSGKTMRAEPVLQAHAPAQPFDNLQQCVTIDMANGHPITMKMRPDLAPIAVETFLKLGTIDHYYNDLTFHRLVPDFVVQGGSPNANEYSGSREFMRDEIGASNVRGTVALSTHGRNAGDAQFFINLVDNPRLDGDYTVFATVQNMDAVDRLQEGDVMRTMTMRSCK